MRYSSRTKFIHYQNYGLFCQFMETLTKYNLVYLLKQKHCLFFILFFVIYTFAYIFTHILICWLFFSCNLYTCLFFYSYIKMRAYFCRYYIWSCKRIKSCDFSTYIIFHKNKAKCATLYVLMHGYPASCIKNIMK